MNKKKNGFIALSGLLLISLSGFLWSRQGADRKEETTAPKQISDVFGTNSIQTTRETNTEEAFNTKLSEAYNRIKPLHVLGKTVDTDGNPVSGVEVQVRWETSGFLIGHPREHNQHIWLTSNEGGEWTFDVKKPSRVFVVDACKNGYAFEKNRSTFCDLAYIRETNKIELVVAIVCMRKKKEEVLLLKSPCADHGDLLLRSKRGEPSQASIDILHKVDSTMSMTPTDEDVHVEAQFDKTNTCWVISFRAPRGADGIQASDDKLYEAPESGYQKEAVIRMPSVQRYQNKDVYLYLRSRSLALYSRIELKMNAAGGEAEDGRPELLIEKQSVTNPYGERSFEDAQELRKYTFARDEIIQEAKKAIESGTVPQKPENLGKHMEARDRILEEEWRNPRR